MQLINKPKLLLLIFICLCSNFLLGQESDNPLEQLISVKARNENISDFLKKIEAQTNILFVYNPDDLKNEELVTLLLHEVKLENVLEIVFDENEIAYRAKADQIVLYKVNVKKTNFNEEILTNKNIKTKRITVSGYVYEAVTGEAMIGANVYETKSLTATVTNNFGFFSLTLPEEEHEVAITYLGFETVVLKLKKSQQLTIEMKPNSNALDEIVVVAENDKKEALSSSQMGVMRISTEKLKAIPSLAGEQDVLKAITLLPGIKQGVDGNAGYYVRGGGPDQNLILMDGVPMYNPYHLWGFLSTFNPDAINNIEIFKGAFPARYGGRLSSVLDVTNKDGNSTAWKKQISLGILSARASISGPIIKERSTIFISARRTLLDLLLTPILAERDRGFVGKTGYNFGDANFKMNYKLSNKDKIYLSGFYSRDALSYIQRSKDDLAGKQSLQDKQGWANGFASLRWNHLFNDKLFLNTTAYYSNFQNYSLKRKSFESLNDELIPSAERINDFKSTIDDIAIKQDYHWFVNDKHNVRFGGALVKHDFNPGVRIFQQIIGTDEVNNNTVESATKTSEYSLYAEDDFAIAKFLKINIGVHGSAYAVEDTTFYSVQPRLSLGLKVTPKLSIKLGYSAMNQNLHLLTSSSILKSSDLWVPATKTITPSQSEQFSGGAAIAIGDQYVLEVEGYYKEMDGLIEYKDGASFFTNEESWEKKVEIGKGDSYGIEFFLQKKTGRFTGWLGYTLSYTNRQFDAINAGTRFPYKYDRRHDISLVGNYKLNEKWAINATWVYFSGNYVTNATAIHINPDYEGHKVHQWLSFQEGGSLAVNGLGENPSINSNAPKRNNLLLPAYHRLDITAVMSWQTKRNNKAEFIFGLTNAYNKFNASFYEESIYFKDQEKENELVSDFTAVTLFPIMPTLSYNWNF